MTDNAQAVYDLSTMKASMEDSKKVVEICTIYAQKGMFNIFWTVFFRTLAFAFADPYLFIGYLISIALFGLFQALFMANAGGAFNPSLCCSRSLRMSQFAEPSTHAGSRVVGVEMPDAHRMDRVAVEQVQFDLRDGGRHLEANDTIAAGRAADRRRAQVAYDGYLTTATRPPGVR